MLHVDVALAVFLSGSVVPLLVGVVTKLHASSRTKAIANLVLSIGAGVLAVLVSGDGSASWTDLFAAAVTAYVASGVSYSNLWKPTGVAPAVQEKTADVGVG